jgi:hypothetical protein
VTSESGSTCLKCSRTSDTDTGTEISRKWSVGARVSPWVRSGEMVVRGYQQIVNRSANVLTGTGAPDSAPRNDLWACRIMEIIKIRRGGRDVLTSPYLIDRQ